jgi:CheY-like chemotaxis protein
MEANAGVGSQEQFCVLVAEDDVLVRMVISDYLRDCGYHVIEAGTADEALTVLEKADVRIHALFSDVQMPGKLDGFDLARLVGERWPDVKIVLASGYSPKIEAAQELCTGPNFFNKPYRVSDIETRLRELMA